MSKHTEGPWIALENCGDWSVYGPDGEPVAAFIRVYPDCAFGIDKDDAHLIAAAPDLLEALEAMNAQLEADGYMGTTYGPLRIAAMAAIAKSKGESQ